MLLVRHAEASGQEADAPLTELGKNQAEQLAGELLSGSIDAVYSSPYLRAQSTAEPIARSNALSVQTLDDLRERVLFPGYLANWREHLQRSFADQDYKMDGGESMAEATIRASAALSQVSVSNHKRPVIVSHGNLIACILRSIEADFSYDDWAALGNAVCYELAFDGAKPVSFHPYASS